MPVTFRDYLNFPFNNGRGIRGDQVVVDSTLEGDATDGLGVSDAFRTQERESFASRYHTGGYRYDRTLFADEYYDTETEIAGVEIWNGVVNVITEGGLIGREPGHGGTYQIPGLIAGETVIDISRHGNNLFVATSENLRVYEVDDVAGTATLQHTYAVDLFKAIAAPNDHNDRVYIARRQATTLQFRRYAVAGDGSLAHEYSDSFTLDDLNAALGPNEPRITQIAQLLALSAYDTDLWIYAQRPTDLKVINISDDDTMGGFVQTGSRPTVSGGTGTGATIDTFVVDANGRITDLTWDDPGSGYVVDDVLTFSQDGYSTSFTLQVHNLMNTDELRDFVSEVVGLGAFVVDNTTDHEIGRLQDVTGATRTNNLEILASRFVVNKFTAVGEDRDGNLHDDTLDGNLYDENDRLRVAEPWGSVNPTSLSSVLTAENAGRPVFYHGEVYYVDVHPQQGHDAVITFAEPINGDFPSGHRWRGSHTGATQTAVSNPMQNDVSYNIDLGRLLIYLGGLWHDYAYNRFVGPGPANSESQARVRIASSSLTPKVGLLVSWHGHGLRRVSAFTAATPMTYTYSLEPAGQQFPPGIQRTFIYDGTANDLPAATGRHDGDVVMVIEDGATPPAGSTFNDLNGDALTNLKRGQIFRYQAATSVYSLFLDGRYPWLAINPTAAELNALLVVENAGLPVMLQGQVWVVHHVHHDGIDAMVTFEDPPATVFGNFYNFRGSITGNNYPSSPSNNDVVFRIDHRRLERYNGTITAWVAWDDTLYTGPASDMNNAIARIVNSPVTPKTSIVTSWVGSGGLRKVATYTAGTPPSEVLDLIPTSLTDEDVQRLIEDYAVMIPPDENGNLPTALAEYWGAANGISRVLSWAHNRIWRVRRDLVTGHNVSATFTEIPDGTTIDGRNYRGVHWQDYLVDNPAEGDYYINRGSRVFRTYRNGAWQVLGADSRYYRDNNILSTIYDSQTAALAHVHANGDRVAYTTTGSNIEFAIVSDFVTVPTHYEYSWEDALEPIIQTQIDANALPIKIDSAPTDVDHKNRLLFYTDNDREDIYRRRNVRRSELSFEAEHEAAITGYSRLAPQTDLGGDIVEFHGQSTQGLVRVTWNTLEHLEVVVRTDIAGPMQSRTNDHITLAYRVNGGARHFQRCDALDMPGPNRRWFRAVDIAASPWADGDTVSFHIYDGPIVEWDVPIMVQMIDDEDMAAAIDSDINTLRVQHAGVAITQNTVFQSTGIRVDNHTILIINPALRDVDPYVRNWQTINNDIAATAAAGNNHNNNNSVEIGDHIVVGKTHADAGELLITLGTQGAPTRQVTIYAFGGPLP